MSGILIFGEPGQYASGDDLRFDLSFGALSWVLETLAEEVDDAELSAILTDYATGGIFTLGTFGRPHARLIIAAIRNDLLPVARLSAPSDLMIEIVQKLVQAVNEWAAGRAWLD
ncbi:hypothetical protein [Amycolatopsis palatopharyngis]|uniref:hypothetical protein n=1 Tax=Amycolatopsis palatopharyngis TaxID=187982 RepID=UPI000E230517|nr:hypothetical protein [Amycolatopsis palatopharyngis]